MREQPASGGRASCSLAPLGERAGVRGRRDSFKAATDSPKLGELFSGAKRLAAAGARLHFLRVHLAHLRLRDFRNYARLDADFAPGFHLLLGDNAQGKTNILEAIYLIATLRSFRGIGSAQMVRHTHKGYFVGATVVSCGNTKLSFIGLGRDVGSVWVGVRCAS